MKLFQQASDLGIADAGAIVGMMYENGQGTPADPAKAVTWYSKAADANSAAGHAAPCRLT